MKRKLLLLAVSLAALGAAYPSEQAGLEPDLCAGLHSSCRCDGTGTLCCSQACLCDGPGASWGGCIDTV